MTAIPLRSEKMPVGGGYAVSFVFEAGKLDCEWHPRLPDTASYMTLLRVGGMLFAMSERPA